MTVTAGTRGEVVTLTPVVSGVTLQAARVNVNDMTPAAEQSSFTASPTTLPADNQASTTLTLTLKNAAGDALSGLASQLSLVMKDGGGTTRAAEVVTLGTLTESGQKGVYTATFRGTVAGKYALVPEYNGSVLGNLSASVTLTAGVAVQAVSHIAVDKASYASGGDIGLTVTLKDAAGNPVVGQEGVLSSAVTVEHAALRGVWSGTAAGEYTATYTAKEAGVGLKASLLLNGWRGAQTATYAITAGAVATDTSTIRTDKTSYASGESMAVTVMLKDTAGNPVPGQVALLPAAVSVAHAELNGSWSDKGEGSYGATYTAKAAGANLQATLTLNGASATPVTYAITAGTVTAATLTADKATYVSGSAIILMATLKDAQGNPVPGQASALTATSVTADNATAGTWSETTPPGTYRATYTAKTAGTGLKAELKLGGASATPVTYAITAGAPVQAMSAIALSGTQYLLGSVMLVTVTLKDAQGNAVIGRAATLTAGAVTVANATLKDNWRDADNGSYVASYTATAVGTGLTATLQLADWSTSVTSEYIIYAAPRINSVNISGPGKVNLELEAQVKGFNSNGTGYDDSLYQWYYKSAAGAWLKPQGEAAKQQRWTPDNSYAGYTIKVGVTPKGKEKAILGEEVFSAEKVIYGAPDAKNVHLMNTVLVGSELKIEYSFIANGTGENTSQYRWYWHDDYASRWRLIDGVTSDRWRVPTSYAGYRVKVEVLPRGSRGDVGVIRPSNTSRVLGALPTPKITWSACWREGLFGRDKALAFSWDVTNIPTDGIRLVTDSGNNYPSSSGEFKRQRSSSSLIKVLFMDEYGYKSKSVMIFNEFSGMTGCNTVVAPES